MVLLAYFGWGSGGCDLSVLGVLAGVGGWWWGWELGMGVGTGTGTGRVG